MAMPQAAEGPQIPEDALVFASSQDMTYTSLRGQAGK
jgi:hypothetical protein